MTKKRKHHLSKPKRSTLDRKFVDGHYKKKFSWFGRCIYCGDTATQLDHVLPVSISRTLDLHNPLIKKELCSLLSLVPSCGECNGMAGGRGFKSILSKRDYIKSRIRKKYKKHLKSLMWDEYELSEMGPIMRKNILYSMGRKIVLMERLFWPEKLPRIWDQARSEFAASKHRG